MKLLNLHYFRPLILHFQSCHGNDEIKGMKRFTVPDFRI